MMSFQRWPRSAGVLLHPTSLPGPFGIGDFGDEAVAWLDFLVDSETSLWQILPLGPTGFGNSPYSSYSSFAGNPLLISPRQLARDGLIDDGDLRAAARPSGGRVDFAEAKLIKDRLLRAAYEAFSKGQSADLRPDLDRFRAVNGSWLGDFCLFMALKDMQGGKAWSDWPRDLRDRDAGALTSAAEELSPEIDFHEFVQFVFSRQWNELRARASDRGITIIGDLPIYVAGDSADVWVNRHLFRLDGEGRPTAVAGVPPDNFSATGQLWGNPLYDWDAHAGEGYAWWIERFRAVTGRVDIVRIDHFRAFADYWEVPPNSDTAEVGRWRPGPGAAVFEALASAVGDLDLIAEDLGDLSPHVSALREQLGLPGMKVLQDAFETDLTHEFLPHNYPVDCIAYTGTHDNNTCIGWYESAPRSHRRLADRYLDWDDHDVAWTMIRAVWESKAMFAISPLQDFLRLGSAARMNSPGTAEGNWDWRAEREALTPELAEEMRALNRHTGRASSSAEPRAQSPESRSD